MDQPTLVEMLCILYCLSMVHVALTPSRKGAWIVNTSKHLRTYDPTNPGLDVLNNITFAGRCGQLLITLSADEDEQLRHNQVKGHARACGINSHELRVYLESLRAYGCLDWDRSQENYEVLASSRQRVLETTSTVLEGSVPQETYDKVLLELLEHCLVRPRLDSELKEFLDSELDEQNINHLLTLVESFQILGTIDTPDENRKLYFNTHKFSDQAHSIGQGLLMLSEDRYEELNVAIDFVDRHPGTPYDDLPASEATKQFVVGMGLVDVSEVVTGEGPVYFLTSPRLSPPSVGKETASLEDDVFHHAKMLLSSFKYGELKSSYGRGRILEPGALVNSLLYNNMVGPCTAIGEDYVNLEAHGVLRTVPARQVSGNQFYMELRRREPAQIVLDLLNSGASDAINTKAVPKNLKLPAGYIGPEVQRMAAYRRTVAYDPQSVEALMRDIRTW